MATKVEPIDVLNDSDVVQGNNYIFYNKSCVDMREVKDSTVNVSNTRVANVNQVRSLRFFILAMPS